MTYEKIVEKMRKAFVTADGWDVNEHKAIQINVRGEGEGALYIELDGGKFNVQPYEYYDNNAEVTIPAKVLHDILDGKVEPAAAYDELKFSIFGDAGLALAILAIRKIPATKKAAKKAEDTAKKAVKAAKPAAKKAADETKKAAKKAVEAAKPAAKKAVEAAKPAAKKVADETKKAAKKAEDTAKKAVEKAEDTAKKAVEAAKPVAKKAADETKKVAKKAEDTAKKAVAKKPVAVKPAEEKK